VSSNGLWKEVEFEYILEAVTAINTECFSPRDKLTARPTAHRHPGPKSKMREAPPACLTVYYMDTGITSSHITYLRLTGLEEIR
jgi:hypothetical protein